MKNFTCTKCGSNKLQEEGKNYICTYCGATILKPFTIPKKRLAFVVASLSILLVGAFITYKLLYSIKTDIQQMKTETQTSHYSPVTTQQNSHTQHLNDDEKNPFADVIMKVEGGYSTKGKENTLEQSIKAYQNYEKNKAFYISLSEDGSYAFGYSYAAKTTKIAEKEALAICQKEKKKRHFTESCIPYAVNNKISRLLIGW